MLWEAAALGGAGMKGSMVFKWVGAGLVAIGLIDMFWGNTSQPVLPEFIGNLLNQQIDAVLIIGGGVMFLYAGKK